MYIHIVAYSKIKFHVLWMNRLAPSLNKIPSRGSYVSLSFRSVWIFAIRAYGLGVLLSAHVECQYETMSQDSIRIGIRSILARDLR